MKIQNGDKCTISGPGYTGHEYVFGCDVPDSDLCIVFVGTRHMTIPRVRVSKLETGGLLNHHKPYTAGENCPTAVMCSVVKASDCSKINWRDVEKAFNAACGFDSIGQLKDDICEHLFGDSFAQCREDVKGTVSAMINAGFVNVKAVDKCNNGEMPLFDLMKEYCQKDVKAGEDALAAVGERVQIEQLAEHLHKTYCSGDKWYMNQSWSQVKGDHKAGWLAVAREFSMMQGSERHLMGVLRDIGKIFNVNVGVDVGVDKLVEHVNTSIRDITSENTINAEKVSMANDFRGKVVDALEIKPQLRESISDEALLSLIKLLGEDEPENEEVFKMRNFMIREMGFGSHCSMNQIRCGLVKRKSNYDELLEIRNIAFDILKIKKSSEFKVDKEVLVKVLTKITTNYRSARYAQFSLDKMIEMQNFMGDQWNEDNPDYKVHDLVMAVIERAEKLCKPLVNQIKEHPELHDLITHLGDFKDAVELRAIISRTVGVDEETTYWVRQLSVVNELIERTN